MSIESVSEQSGAGSGLKKERRKKSARSATAPTLDRLPPHSAENERGVLGCILFAPETALQALDECKEAGVEPRWFYDLRHQLIYTALCKLAAGGIPVDMITLMTQLEKDGTLEQCSGIAYLNELQDAVAGVAYIKIYLEVVREQWQLRQIVSTCTEIVTRAYDCKGPVDELMGTLERDFLAVTSPAVRAREKHLREYLLEVTYELENYHKGGVQLSGLPTGLPYLDKVIGGIGPDWYCVLAGRPGSGKTTLALDIINYLATEYVWWKTTPEKNEDGTEKKERMQGIPIGVFSLEMSGKSLGKRLLFSMARVSAGKFKQGFMSNGDFQSLINACPKLAQAKIYLDEEPSQTIGKIRAKAQRMARQYGIKLFVLDYLQLVLPDQRGNRPDRVQELADISAQIVYLKKKLGIPWLVLAQMNRNIETSERVRVPVLSDLKDCGCIEQDADIVTFLHKPGFKDIQEDDEIISGHYANVEFSERPRRIDAVVAKNRDGATGIAKLLFHSNQFHFEDWHQWQVKNGYTEAAKGERLNSPRKPELPTDEELAQ